MARLLDEHPDLLIGNRAHGSNPLDAELAEMGIEMIAPHNPTRKHKTRDGRPLSPVSATVAHRTTSLGMAGVLASPDHALRTYGREYLAFLKLRCIVILLRRL